MLGYVWKYRLFAKIWKELKDGWIVVFKKINKHSGGRKYISIPAYYKELFYKGLLVEVKIFEIISEAEMYIGKKYELPTFTREVVSIGQDRLAVFIPSAIKDFVEVDKEYIVAFRPIYKSEEEKEEKKKEVEKARDKVQKTLREWGLDLS